MSLMIYQKNNYRRIINMENNDLEKNQSSLDFENEELSIFNQEKQ